MPCFPSSRRRSPAGLTGSPWLLPAAAGLALAVLAGAPTSAQVSFGVNRVLTISAEGSPEQNCAGLRSALAQVPDLGEFYPHLLRLEPGFFDCGELPVVVGPNTHLEGAGVRATLITSRVQLFSTGTIHVMNRSELRDLSVFNFNSGEAIAVSVSPAGPCMPSDHSGCGESAIRNVHARADGDRGSTALLIDTSEGLRVFNSRLSAGIAVSSFDSPVEIESSHLQGSVIAFGADQVLVSFSRLSGSVAGSALRCVYSFDAITLAPRSATCT